MYLVVVPGLQAKLLYVSCVVITRGDVIALNSCVNKGSTDFITKQVAVHVSACIQF